MTLDQMGGAVWQLTYSEWHPECTLRSSKLMKSVGLDVAAIANVVFPMTNSHNPKLLPRIVMIDGADDCREVGWMPSTTGSGYLAKIKLDSTMDPAISNDMRQSPTVPCMNVHFTDE